MSTQTETFVIADTKTVKTDGDCNDSKKWNWNMDMSNGSGVFIGAIIVMIILFLLLMIVANNSTASYYGLTLPSWAPSLSVWAILFALVFLFTAFALAKAYAQGGAYKSSWFGLGIVITLILWLISVFIIFQTNNFRAAFWVAVAAGVLTLILLFYVGCTSKAAAGWLIPLLLLEIFYLAEVWQIISLNNL
jgi:tryptophan-rich sensory protein